MPMSATPSSTYCGISSSLKKKTSKGKLNASAFNLFKPLSNSIPHSFNNLSELSESLPDF